MMCEPCCFGADYGASHWCDDLDRASLTKRRKGCTCQCRGKVPTAELVSQVAELMVAGHGDS